MRNTLGFIANYLLALLFSNELLNMYFGLGKSIISSDVNRPIIAWMCFIVTFVNSIYFINKRFKN